MQFLDLLPCSSSNSLSPLESIDLEHGAHLFFFEIGDAVFGHSGLLLDIRKVLLNLIEVVECNCELIKVLS